MNFLTYCQPLDFMERIYRRGIYGFYHGEPKVILKDSEGGFSKLFIDCGDRTLAWEIYTPTQESKDQVVAAAQTVLRNFEHYMYLFIERI